MRRPAPRRHAGGTTGVLDDLRAVAHQLATGATGLPPQLAAALADTLLYEAGLPHERIGAARAAPGGWAGLCSCGGGWLQRGVRVLGCVRLRQAHQLALACRGLR